MVWDLVVVGAGPAGTATALGALAADPSLSVLLVDRHDFPRDKPCGDGIAPQVLDLLESVGVTGLLDDRTPVRRLALRRGELEVARDMARPAWVVPRKVFDQRLVEAAQAAGAHLVRHRVKSIDVRRDSVQVDHLAGAIVVGADGANSVVRRAIGERDHVAGNSALASSSAPSSSDEVGRDGSAERRWRAPGEWPFFDRTAGRPVALAIRGYAPTPPERAARQEIVFGLGRQPSYAWSFDRGDGLSNVGYGEQLISSRPHPTRAELLERLEELLPGASADGGDWRGHHLPLSSWSWRPRNGRVLLAGDAAGLINPMTGEGIYYAIASGLLAGQAAAAAIRSGNAGRGGELLGSATGRWSGRTRAVTVVDAGAAYRRTAGRLLGSHLRHTALTALLCRSGWVLDRGIRASAADQGVFDDLVEIGLANGRITPQLVRGLLKPFAGWP
ncbi:hyaluronate lyase [Kribbella qitaiheensis]|uniref:Hyaluronate lyase n=1 Tax=Kribbella qitaiheensis TaxID=1544730 RepID=A0A7G6XAF8_9ACTN|nr:hyaluronate lyase [Kribbella qitaiheensis]